jgi:hypothetical protein
MVLIYGGATRSATCAKIGEMKSVKNIDNNILDDIESVVMVIKVTIFMP